MLLFAAGCPLGCPVVAAVFCAQLLKLCDYSYARYNRHGDYDGECLSATTTTTLWQPPIQSKRCSRHISAKSVLQIGHGEANTLFMAYTHLSQPLCPCVVQFSCAGQSQHPNRRTLNTNARKSVTRPFANQPHTEKLYTSAMNRQSDCATDKPKVNNAQK